MPMGAHLPPLDHIFIGSCLRGAVSRRRLTVDHSISSGGFLLRGFGRSPLTRDEVKLLEKRMGEYDKRQPAHDPSPGSA